MNKTIIPIATIKSTDCPKFHTCNANVCPLDRDWRKRSHLSDEKACVYLLESAKTDASSVFERAGLSNMFEAIAVVREDILSSCAAINRASKRAATTPSRLNPKFAREGQS